MRLQLFEYVVLKNPRDEKKENTELIVEKKTILARDQKTAAMIATREIPEKFMKDLDLVEVVVRSF